MTQLTKKAIRDSFRNLLEQKPLNKITVRDIVTGCGINRNSFYYHYRGIPELCEEILREECDRLIQTYPTVDSLEQGMDAIIHAVLANRKALLHVFRSTERALFERYLWREARYIVESYLNAVYPMDVIVPADRELVYTSLTADTFGQVMHGLESGLKPEVIESTRRFYELRHGMIEQLLSRCTRL